jgi:hypothetical protein
VRGIAHADLVAVFERPLPEDFKTFLDEIDIKVVWRNNSRFEGNQAARTRLPWLFR